MRFTLSAVILGLAVGACNSERSGADANSATVAPAEDTATAAAIAPASPAASSAVPLPPFEQGMPYPRVRAQLREMGWSPYAPPGDMQVPSGILPRGCTPGDDACRGFTETIFCLGASSHSCWHAWRRGQQYLLVVAEGEMEGQVFGELRECSAIMVSNDDPWDWCTPPGSAGTASGETPSSQPKLSAERPTNLSDFLELFPRALPAWRRIVPPSSRRTEWIYELAANSSDVRYLHLRNVEYAHGGYCKPRDCFDNNGSYLIALDGSRAVGATMSSQSTWTGGGWVRDSSRISYFGNPLPNERAILRAELHRTAF